MNKLNCSVMTLVNVILALSIFISYFVHSLASSVNSFKCLNQECSEPIFITTVKTGSSLTDIYGNNKKNVNKSSDVEVYAINNKEKKLYIKVKETGDFGLINSDIVNVKGQAEKAKVSVNITELRTRTNPTLDSHSIHSFRQKNVETENNKQSNGTSEADNTASILLEETDNAKQSDVKKEEILENASSIMNDNLGSDSVVNTVNEKISKEAGTNPNILQEHPSKDNTMEPFEAPEHIDDKNTTNDGTKNNGQNDMGIEVHENGRNLVSENFEKPEVGEKFEDLKTKPLSKDNTSESTEPSKGSEPVKSKNTLIYETKRNNRHNVNSEAIDNGNRSGSKTHDETGADTKVDEESEMSVETDDLLNDVAADSTATPEVSGVTEDENVSKYDISENEEAPTSEAVNLMNNTNDSLEINTEDTTRIDAGDSGPGFVELEDSVSNKSSNLAKPLVADHENSNDTANTENGNEVDPSLVSNDTSSPENVNREDLRETANISSSKSDRTHDLNEIGVSSGKANADKKFILNARPYVQMHQSSISTVVDNHNANQDNETIPPTEILTKRRNLTVSKTESGKETDGEGTITNDSEEEENTVEKIEAKRSFTLSNSQSKNETTETEHPTSTDGALPTSAPELKNQKVTDNAIGDTSVPTSDLELKNQKVTDNVIGDTSVKGSFTLSNSQSKNETTETEHPTSTDGALPTSAPELKNQKVTDNAIGDTSVPTSDLELKNQIVTDNVIGDTSVPDAEEDSPTISNENTPLEPENQNNDSSVVPDGAHDDRISVDNGESGNRNTFDGQSQDNMTPSVPVDDNSVLKGDSDVKQVEEENSNPVTVADNLVNESDELGSDSDLNNSEQSAWFSDYLSGITSYFSFSVAGAEWGVFDFFNGKLFIKLFAEKTDAVATAGDHCFSDDQTCESAAKLALPEMNMGSAEDSSWNYNSYIQALDELLSIDTDFKTYSVFGVLIFSLIVMILMPFFCMKSKSEDSVLISKINQLENKLLVATKEIVSLEEIIDEHNSHEKDESLVEVQVDETVIASISDLKNRNEFLEDRNGYLENELKNLSESALEMHKLLEESLTIQTNFKDSVDEVNTLKTLLKEKDTELGKAKKKMETLIVENGCLITENNLLKTDLEDSNNKYEAQVKTCEEAKDKNEKLMLELKSLENQIYSVEHRYKSEINDFNQKIDTYELKLKKLELENQQLSKIFKSGNPSDETRYSVHITTLEALNEELAGQMKQEKNARLTLEEHVHSLIKELDNMKKSYDTAEKVKMEAVIKLDVLENYFKEKEKELLREIEIKEKRYIERDGQDQLLSQKLMMLREEINNCKSQNDALKKEITDQERSYKTQLANAEQKTRDHWLALRQAERKYKESQQEAASLRNKITQLESSMNNSKLNSDSSPALNGLLNGDVSPLPPPPLPLPTDDFFPPEPLYWPEERLPPLGGRRALTPPLPMIDDDFFPPEPLTMDEPSSPFDEPPLPMGFRNRSQFKGRQRAAGSSSSEFSMESLDKSSR